MLAFKDSSSILHRYPSKILRLEKYFSSQRVLYHNGPFERGISLTNTASSTDAIKDQLELDENLEGFFDENLVKQTKKSQESAQGELNSHKSFPPKQEFDTLDPSDIPVYDEKGNLTALDSPKPSNKISPLLSSHIGSNISSSDILRGSNRKLDDDSTRILLENRNSSRLPESFSTNNFKIFMDFFHYGDSPNPNRVPTNAKLEDLVDSKLPMVFISRFRDPRINLSIERYIYNHLPDAKKNQFAKRLVLYRNSPCIVIGKNQNPYKEINLHLANILQIPILRRYSGGGTVCHDLGNVNFSFMAGKSLFNRTGFTNILIRTLNSIVGKKFDNIKFPKFQLTTNAKGDMINSINQRKVSGSAYQLSRGRYLHHGTMLLNADLHVMSSLLHLSPEKKKCIEDKSIKSIPSPIQNISMDPELFEYCCVNSFSSNYGVPSFLSNPANNNLLNLKFGNAECRVMKLDNITDLPEEVIKEYNTFKSWNWVFGRTPKFKLHFRVGRDIDICLHVHDGKIVEMEASKDLSSLSRLKANLGKVDFRGSDVSHYIEDANIAKGFEWNIDQGVHYQDSLGLILN